MNESIEEFQTRNPGRFTVVTLKELLRLRDLFITGNKAELIGRLTEADPTESWFEEAARIQGLNQDSSSNAGGLPIRARTFIARIGSR